VGQARSLDVDAAPPANDIAFVKELGVKGDDLPATPCPGAGTHGVELHRDGERLRVDSNDGADPAGEDTFVRASPNLTSRYSVEHAVAGSLMAGRPRSRQSGRHVWAVRLVAVMGRSACQTPRVVVGRIIRAGSGTDELHSPPTAAGAVIGAKWLPLACS
jgi:hypothetical protein